MDGQHISHKNRKPSGPIFDKKPLSWKRIYVFGGTGVAVGIAIILWMTGVFWHTEVVQNDRKSDSALISVTVIRGDGYVRLSRKALLEYLSTRPSDISPGQKIFIEEELRKAIVSDLRVGDAVMFSPRDIESAMTKARQLSPLQLEAWSRYARGVKFN